MPLRGDNPRVRSSSFRLLHDRVEIAGIAVERRVLAARDRFEFRDQMRHAHRHPVARVNRRITVEACPHLVARVLALHFQPGVTRHLVLLDEVVDGVAPALKTVRALHSSAPCFTGSTGFTSRYAYRSTPTPRFSTISPRSRRASHSLPTPRLPPMAGWHISTFECHWPSLINAITRSLWPRRFVRVAASVMRTSPWPSGTACRREFHGWPSDSIPRRTRP